MPGALEMAKKRRSQRSPKNKERQEAGFRTIGIRVSDAFAIWLTEAAEHDRASIAGFLDRAATDRARAIGFPKPAPPRIP